MLAPCCPEQNIPRTLIARISSTCELIDGIELEIHYTLADPPDLCENPNFWFGCVKVPGASECDDCDYLCVNLACHVCEGEDPFWVLTTSVGADPNVEPTPVCLINECLVENPCVTNDVGTVSDCEAREWTRTQCVTVGTLPALCCDCAETTTTVTAA